MKSGYRIEPPELGAGDIHLWWSQVAQEGDAPEETVSSDELARADRFHRDRDRRRFLFRRTRLRALLGAYTGTDPASLSFAKGPHGKPAFAKRALSGWSFNLSHSEGHILIAVARGLPIGVDVQGHRLRTDLMGMVRQVFAPAELAAFKAVDPTDRLGIFFRVWVRKEAALKVTGIGLARDPRTLNVGIEARDNHERWEPTEDASLARYAFETLAAPEGFSACVAAPMDGWDRTVVVEGPEAAPGS